MDHSSKVALKIRGIKKAFGDKLVHDGVEFDLYENEVLGLFGTSGSGKSVILRSIIGLEKPDSGSILFEGKDITQMSEHDLNEIRKKIAYVFQHGALFDSLTVQENLAYPLREHTKLSEEEILKKVNEMLDLIDMRGSNDLLPAELSGGMQKRAGVARAIIMGPQITLFDEPTAGLDPVNTQRLIDNLQKLKDKGMTGIFVTHDIPSALQISDRIAFLHNKKIYYIDTVENIKKSKDPIVESFVKNTVEGIS